MINEYEVTPSAGPRVSGIRHEGAGTRVKLTAGQAEHPLRLGHIVLCSPAPENRKPKRNGRRR